MPIYFYTSTDVYGCFSNFSRHGFELGGRYWPTAEHYFQAQKFAGTDHEEEVRRSKTAREAANLGRSRKLPLRRDWEGVKDQVMLEGVQAKFTQHEDLKAILLGTGDAKLVEHTERDAYWGDGGDGSGQNRLGQILMQVRDELRAAGG
jgi:N-glycosidase YbiA